MKLNPTNCAFDVKSGKFLGMMISQRGIEANPYKIQPILDMQPSKSINDVQKLTGRVAALGRFMSRLGDKCLHFFSVLKKVKNFTWTYECQKAFGELKEYLAHPPLLENPTPSELLFLYLDVSEQAISAVLIKNEYKVQKHVYYVSKVLHGAKLNYSKVEKFALTLIMTTRKL